MALEAQRSKTQVESSNRIGGRMRSLNGLKTHLTIGRAVIPLILFDALCIASSMGGAYWMRFRLLDYGSTLSPSFYGRLILFALPAWLVIFALCRLYQPQRLFGGLQEYADVFRGCAFGLLAILLCGFLDRSVESQVSRGWWALVWLFSVGSVSTMRFGYRRLIYALRRRGWFARRALIVGSNREGRVVASQLEQSPTSGVSVVGFLAPDQPSGEIDGLPIWGTLDDLDEVIGRLGVTELIVIPTALPRERLLDIYRDWGSHEAVRVSLSSGLYELFTTGVQVREVGFVPLVSLNQTRITGMDALMKTALDYVGALMGTLVLLPFYPVVAVLIWLDSPGPIFHRRRVVGLHGRQFDAFKLRTMIPRADEYLMTHPELEECWVENGKIPDDPRVTHVGRFLRRYSLDELPQLINVLRGEMSLVGPRMITPSELKHFGLWRHNLLTVKPGMTGLWQVNGRADLDYAERVKLDMHYIRNYTIWVDLKVLFDTFRAVISGRGAY